MIKRNHIMDRPSDLSWIASLFIILNYIGFLFVYPSVALRILNVESLPMSFNYVNLVMLIIITLLLAKPLFDQSSQFARFDFKIVKKAGKLYLLMMVVTIISNLIIMNLTQTTGSENQEQIVNILSNIPIYAILATLIMAPIVEEVIFRGIFYRKIRSVKAFGFPILFSSISFGFLHVAQSLFTGNWIDLVYVLIYSILGLFMVKIYEETAHISSAIFLHFLNNFVGIALIIVGLWIL